ncbi:hypothetical protein ANN_07640 [Periplaneta americana]|uniref:Uncharacterized protein n=1 Tax=Periplaneta americana TaxID=6978 RepID=A0ABQ8T0J4_PERAM|nr:hypothetical protein ANN_07640 [Periplaneta americana]
MMDIFSLDLMKNGHDCRGPIILEPRNTTLKKITVTGLFFGARGTIPKAFVKWRENNRLKRSLQDENFYGTNLDSRFGDIKDFIRSVAVQPVKGLDRPAGCWPHAHMPKQRWTIIQPEWRYRVISTMIPPAVIAGIRNRISLPIVAPQVHHDAGWAPVPYTGRNFMRKFLPHEDSNQRAFRNASPRQDALDHDATARDNCYLLGYLAASKRFSVPRSTLFDYVRSNSEPTKAVKSKLGRKPILPASLKEKLVDYVLMMERKYFG